MKEQSDDIFPDCKVVDDFVKRFYDDEIKLSSDADHTDFNNEKGELTTLTAFLSDALTNYTTAKSSLLTVQMGTSKLKHDEAIFSFEMKEWDKVRTWRTYLLQAITHAKSLNLIIETEKMSSKLKKIENENKQLRKENALLKKQNEEMTENLNKYFPNTQKGNKEYGEVK